MRKPTKKIKLVVETLRPLTEAQLALANGGLERDTSKGRWTDGWCDLTWSGGYICASLATYC